MRIQRIFTNALIALTLLGFVKAEAHDVVTFDQLKTLIEAREVKSIETLLPLLPPAYLQNFTLMKQSHSAQGATPLNPRVLLFGESAQSVLSFNGGHDQRGKDSIEMLEFKTETGKFEFREIRFAEGRVTFSDANPAKCIGCHQGRVGDLRPNWDEYPKWENAYGSDDDVLTPEERTQLDDFLKVRKDHPRYKNLVMPDGGPYFGERFGPFIGRPNLRLTSLLARWNARKIVTQLKSNSSFPFWRDLVLLENTNDESAYQRGLAKAQAIGLLSSQDVQEISKGRSVLDWLSAATQLNARDWSLKFMGKEGFPESSTRTSRASKLIYSYFDGYFQTYAIVMGELWRDAGHEVASQIRFKSLSEEETAKRYSVGIENFPVILDSIIIPQDEVQLARPLAPSLEQSLMKNATQVVPN